MRQLYDNEKNLLAIMQPSALKYRHGVAVDSLKEALGALRAMELGWAREWGQRWEKMLLDQKTRFFHARHGAKTALSRLASSAFLAREQVRHCHLAMSLANGSGYAECERNPRRRPNFREVANILLKSIPVDLHLNHSRRFGWATVDQQVQDLVTAWEAGAISVSAGARAREVRKKKEELLRAVSRATANVEAANARLEAVKKELEALNKEGEGRNG